MFAIAGALAGLERQWHEPPERQAVPTARLFDSKVSEFEAHRNAIGSWSAVEIEEPAEAHEVIGISPVGSPRKVLYPEPRLPATFQRPCIEAGVDQPVWGLADRGFVA